MTLRCIKFDLEKSEVENTNVCPHGAEKNACDKLQCLSGLGEKCGETESLQVSYGKCANGLMCCSGYCTGCHKGICDGRICRSVS